jgi:hypothetical protein
MCCFGRRPAVVDICSNDPSSATDNELFYQSFIYRIWVGNAYASDLQYPDGDSGYYKRHVFMDGMWAGVLIGEKAFTGQLAHNLQVQDTWDLMNVAESEEGLTVLCFKSTDHVFTIQEDTRYTDILSGLEARCRR